MSLIQQVGNGIGQDGSPADSTPGGALGKEEFMSLLTAQLSNQDPLNPMDSTDMVAQLAQFSALEQMQNLNVSYDLARREQNVIQSLVLAGENVKLTLNDGAEVEGVVEKVGWNEEEGGSTVYIDGSPYALKNILNIAKATEPTV